MTHCDIIGCKNRGTRYYSNYWGYEQYLCPQHKAEVVQKEELHKLLKI